MDTEAWLALIIGCVVIAAIILVFFELVGRAIGRIARRAGARKPTVRSILETARILGIVLAALSVVTYAGLASVLAVLTVSGIAALAISLALQSTLSNMVAGVLLLRDRSIRYGDVITYSGIKGRVIRVALRNTWIVTDAGVVAIISNGNLNNGPLINHTASPGFLRDFDEPAPPSPPPG